MLYLACHLCFRPRFMSDHPELYYWIYLLPVALVAFWAIRFMGGKMKATDLLSHSILAYLTYSVLWKMGAFRLLIYPLLLLVFGFLGWTLIRSERASKIVAALTLGLFLVTAIYAHRERGKRGAYWELYKPQAGGSFSWIATAAKEKRFSKDQLLAYLKSDNEVVRGNATQIAILQGKEETQLEQAREFHQALQQIDPSAAEQFFTNLPFELQIELRPPKPRKERR